MSTFLSDNTTNLLQTFLDVQSRRAEIVAGNIANADTPGFVAKDLDFNDYLRDAAKEAERSPVESKFPLSAPKVVEQTPTAIGVDGNTVDVGKEMSNLAQTGGAFNFGAKMLQSRLRLLRTAIREGR
jgi:flagellar basal-body rod protein FlgB